MQYNEYSMETKQQPSSKQNYTVFIWNERSYVRFYEQVFFKVTSWKGGITHF